MLGKKLKDHKFLKVKEQEMLEGKSEEHLKANKKIISKMDW